MIKLFSKTIPITCFINVCFYIQGAFIYRSSSRITKTPLLFVLPLKVCNLSCDFILFRQTINLNDSKSLDGKNFLYEHNSSEFAKLREPRQHVIHQKSLICIKRQVFELFVLTHVTFLMHPL